MMGLLTLFSRKPEHFSPHDFALSAEIAERKPVVIKRLNIVEDIRVKTTDPGATMEEKFYALIKLRDEVDTKLR